MTFFMLLIAAISFLVVALSVLGIIAGIGYGIYLFVVWTITVFGWFSIIIFIPVAIVAFFVALIALCYALQEIN